ncbi:LysR family transcriptional regulator (plasmid) [Neorhizobium galegae]|nr:LysR family transcriptional regulator [Neorhizobium galegae]
MNKNLHRLDLRQLRHFIAVVHTGSFSMAAENLRLTQPALSKSIRSMEQSLGVRLLDRGPSGVQATIFGQRLIGYSELLLSLASEAIDEIDALRGARRGSLRNWKHGCRIATTYPRCVEPLRGDTPRCRPDGA